MLDAQDLETIDSLSLEWLENMLNQYKKANLPCQVKEMTKLVKLKKERLNQKPVESYIGRILLG